MIWAYCFSFCLLSALTFTITFQRLDIDLRFYKHTQQQILKNQEMSNYNKAMLLC